MSEAFQAIGVLLGVAVAGFAALALVAGYRAVRIAGWWLLFNGMVWFTGSERVPPEAWPHIRRALARWGMAMLCFVLAAAAGAASRALA